MEERVRWRRGSKKVVYESRYWVKGAEDIQVLGGVWVLFFGTRACI